jgi:hypothetical protein
MSLPPDPHDDDGNAKWCARSSANERPAITSDRAIWPATAPTGGSIAQARRARNPARTRTGVQSAGSGYVGRMGRSATTSGAPARSRGQKLLWSPVAVFLVLLMAVGSVIMWIGVPLGLIAPNPEPPLDAVSVDVD